MHGSQFFTKLCNLCLVKVMFSLGAHSTIQLYTHCTCACIVSVYLQNGVHEYKMQAPIPLMSYSLSVAGSDGHSELAVSLSLPGWLSELSPTYSWISEEYKMQVWTGKFTHACEAWLYIYILAYVDVYMMKWLRNIIENCGLNWGPLT